MRTILSGVIFLVVFAVVPLPFVLFRMAAERGDLESLSPTGMGIFAAVSGVIGWGLASMASQSFRETQGSLVPKMPTVRLTRTRLIQVLFLSVALALVSITLQHYPVYQSFVGFRLGYRLEDLFESGWLVIAGGLIALACSYKLVRGASDEGDDA